MLKTNYHTHSYYCDGIGAPEDYLREAAKRGLAALGFSSHAPVPFTTQWTMKQDNLQAYLRHINALKENGPADLQVYLGLEIDYLRDMSGPGLFQDMGLDYTIGAVHMLGYSEEGRDLSVDGPDEEFEELYRIRYGEDIKRLVRDYYTLIAELLEQFTFDFLAHFDLVKKKNRHNRYFDENDRWYRTLAMDTLTLAAEKGIPLEINSGGISRGAIDSVYPSPWLLKEAHRLSIPIIISSDAHRPEHVDFYFEESGELCLEAGYRESLVLLNGTWQMTRITR